MSNADAQTTRLGGLVSLFTRESPRDNTEQAGLLPRPQPRGASRQSMKIALSLRNKAADRKVLLFAGLDTAFASTALVRSIGNALIEAAEQPILLIVPDLNDPWAGSAVLAEGTRARSPVSSSSPADFPTVEIRPGLTEMRVPIGARGIRPGPGSAFDELLRKLREQFRFILMVAPTDGNETDRTLLALLSDGMVVVVERDRQSRASLQDVQRELASNLIPVLGFVLADGHGRDNRDDR